MSEAVHRCDFYEGDCINGKYHIEKVMGEGAFGKVYKVRDLKSSQTCALKLFKFWELPPAQRESMYARFQMEYETGQIYSDYLVRSIEYGSVKNNPFIVMEFCPNGDLLQYATKQKRIDFLKVGREVLYGLKDLHRCGKVHRDLKPENVLIKSNGTAALTDFGISGDRKKQITVTDLFGRPKEIAGSVIYMAPEQTKPKNREVTVLPTMDIFAFGVMMYQLITNKYPFGQLDNEDDMVRYIQNAREGRWNRSLLCKYSDGKKYEKAINGCLIPDFKHRLKTVDMVLSLLPHHSDLLYEQPQDSMQNSIVHGVLLRVMQGEDYGKIYKLNDLLRGRSKVITVGCNDPFVDNILAITESHSRYISRKHCTLELAGNNKWFIRDGQWDKSATNAWKNSLNGTFINSTEAYADGLPIQLGDIISIGDVKLRVEGY